MPLRKSTLKWHSLIGPIDVLGETNVHVTLPNSKTINKLPLVVRKSETLTVLLLGRNWLDCLFPQWRSSWLSINALDPASVVNTFKLLYPKVFDKTDSNIADFEAHLTLKPDAHPVFMKPYQIPYGMVEVVSSKIQELKEKGKIEKISFSKYASPCIPIRKKTVHIVSALTSKKRLIQICN